MKLLGGAIIEFKCITSKDKIELPVNLKIKYLTSTLKCSGITPLVLLIPYLLISLDTFQTR